MPGGDRWVSWNLKVDAEDADATTDRLTDHEAWAWERQADALPEAQASGYAKAFCVDEPAVFRHGDRHARHVVLLHKSRYLLIDGMQFVCVKTVCEAAQ